MALGLASGVADGILDTFGTTYKYAQLHTGDPGAAGTTTVATNSTRKLVTWDSSSGGLLASSADTQWTNVGGTEDYTHYSLWSALTAGTFGASGLVTANPVTTGDTFTLPTGDVTVELTDIAA